MKYLGPKNQNIQTIADWEDCLFKDPKKAKHWKDGRSAKSIAKFMMQLNGEKVISDLISSLLGKKVILDTAYPEMEVRFDEYGHGREHDLGIEGKTESGESIFIGLEAKVDESFNERVSEVYFKAKAREINGESTNAAKRIDKLLKRNFDKVKSKHFNLRYQLLYSTIGTLDRTADISILLIIVFKTDKYDEIKGLENYKDYIEFIRMANSKRVNRDKEFDIHEIQIDGKVLYSIYLNQSIP